MSNPILPRTNSTPGAGAPPSLYLAEMASNRSTGTLYLGCDSGVEVVGERVTSIARGGTASTTAAAALAALGAAPLASPAFTGTPTAPTATAGTNSTQLATTAFVQSNRGDRYLTTSSTTWTLANGVQTFTVGAGLAYTPTQDVVVVYNSSNHAHGQVVSYSGTTLVVDVHQHAGGGTYSVWTINVGGLSTANGALLQANNLSDVANPATALTNIGGVSTADVIDIAHGGTAATTQQAALNSIVGSVTANCVVSGDGTNVTLRPLTNADIPLLNLSKLAQNGATTSQVLGYTVSGWAPKTLTTSDIVGYSGGGAVTSVAGRTGAVTLTTADIAGYSAGGVTSVAGRTGAVTLTTADIAGYSSGGAVTSVAGRTGAVTLTTADIASFATAAASAAPVQSVAGRTGAITLTTADIAGYSSGGAVTSVAGRTGAVTLTTADIGGLSSSYVANGGNASVIRVLTQAQYNALTPDASTIYVITA